MSQNITTTEPNIWGVIDNHKNQLANAANPVSPYWQSRVAELLHNPELFLHASHIIEGGDTSANTPVHELFSSLITQSQYPRAITLESLSGGIHSSIHSLQQLFNGLIQETPEGEEEVQPLISRFIEIYTEPLLRLEFVNSLIPAQPLAWKFWKGIPPLEKSSRILKFPPQLLPAPTFEQLELAFAEMPNLAEQLSNISAELYENVTNPSLADFMLAVRSYANHYIGNQVGIDCNLIQVVRLESALGNLLPDWLLNMTVNEIIEYYNQNYEYYEEYQIVKHKGRGYMALHVYDPHLLLTATKNNAGHNDGWGTIKIAVGNDGWQASVAPKIYNSQLNTYLNMSVREVLATNMGFSGKLGNILYSMICEGQVINRVRMEKSGVYAVHNNLAPNKVLPTGRLLITTPGLIDQSPDDPQPLDIVGLMAMPQWSDQQTIQEIYELAAIALADYQSYQETRIVLFADGSYTVEHFDYNPEC